MNRPGSGGTFKALTQGPRCLRLVGALERDSVDALRASLTPWTGPGAVELDLTELEIADASGALAAVEAIRALAAVAQPVVIRGAPQLLGHNLYRAGLLETGSRIELIDMREDEPYG